MRPVFIKRLVPLAALGAVALATVALARAVPETFTSPRLASLGSPSLCAAGTGLPPAWGTQPHAGMVRVPGGEFVFGSATGYPDEQPATAERQRVAGFWIDQTEVTNAQFAAFVHATGYVTEAERQGAAVVFHTPDADELQRRPYAWWRYVRGANWKEPHGSAAPAPNAPVTLVTQADALAYAQWLGRDLPTEAEWEYAAKAGRPDAGLDSAPVDAQGRPDANYWQGPFPLADAAEDGHAGLAPVGCYRANAFKLHDMIGNAWEWTKDGYTGARQPHSNGDTAAVVASTVARQPNLPMVIKGGSFLCAPSYCIRYRASAREAQEADLGASHIGFRTVQRDR